MLRHFCRLTLILGSALLPGLRAGTPPLLATAFEQWAAGREDLAFTQQTRSFFDDGKVREERTERYDPSLPDSRRWRLIAIDGQPATVEQREKWEAKKNGKPRRKVATSPAEYLDLEHAAMVEDSPRSSQFEISLRPAAARLLAVEKISVVITVDKDSRSIAHIAASLRQPIRVLLGLARITDLDLDVGIEPTDRDFPGTSGDVQAGGTARVTVSKLGTPMDYNWSDFKRVASYRGP